MFEIIITVSQILISYFFIESSSDLANFVNGVSVYIKQINSS